MDRHFAPFAKYFKLRQIALRPCIDNLINTQNPLDTEWFSRNAEIVGN